MENTLKSSITPQFEELFVDLSNGLNF